MRKITMIVCLVFCGCSSTEYFPHIEREVPESTAELERNKSCVKEYELSNNTGASRIVHWTNKAGTRTDSETQEDGTIFVWTDKPDGCTPVAGYECKGPIPSKVTVCQNGCIDVFVCEAGLEL